MAKTKVLIAYIPVVHQGYFKWMSSHPDASQLWLLDKTTISDYRPLVKDLRALEASQIKNMIAALDIFADIKVLDAQELQKVSQSPASQDLQLIAPDEDISHQILDPIFGDKVKYESVFLRWDALAVKRNNLVQPDVKLSKDLFDQKMMAAAKEISEKSSDWWRQVGAVLIPVGNPPITVRNLHVPHDQQQYIDGDPRTMYQSGEHIEQTSSIHAEAEAIAQAAKQGQALAGASMYVTTFPCPVCAKLIARSGIAKLYFETGYSLLDGAEVLAAAKVEIIQVAA